MLTLPKPFLLHQSTIFWVIVLVFFNASNFFLHFDHKKIIGGGGLLPPFVNFIVEKIYIIYNTAIELVE